MTDALVIGAGPAGLMAAQVLSSAGWQVIVADQMPSVGRKFLMAGKSGLNLTKADAPDAYMRAFGPVSDDMADALRAFGPTEVQDWARALGQTVFTGSTGRVFPSVMKASPLLRAWLARLNAAGVGLRTRWRWIGWDGADTVFDTPDGRVALRPKVTVLALGGASWARLGSDGAWADLLDDIIPFRPANCGLAVNWSSYMEPHRGSPIKATALMAGGQVSRGEWVISEQGMEGGGVYEIFAAMRDGAALTLDLMPDVALAEVVARVAGQRRKSSISQMLRKGLRLSPVKIALFQECARDLPTDTPEGVARAVKALPIPVAGALKMDGAISTAGGVSLAALGPGFALRARPNVFCAGEMLDWEAPTGGYLISGCLATGRWAGLAAARFLSSGQPASV